jgi:hypothetical protein
MGRIAAVIWSSEVSMAEAKLIDQRVAHQR